VCGRKTLAWTILRRLLDEMGSAAAGGEVSEVGEVVACGGCGGKFIA